MVKKFADIIDINPNKDAYVYSIDDKIYLDITINVNINDFALDKIVINHGFQFFFNVEQRGNYSKLITVYDEKANVGQQSNDYHMSLPILCGNITIVDKLHGSTYGGYNFIEVMLYSKSFDKPITKKIKLNVEFPQNTNNIWYISNAQLDEKTTTIDEFTNKWSKQIKDNDDFVRIWRFKYPVIVDKQGGESDIKKLFGDFVSRQNYKKMKNNSFTYRFFENYINSPVRKTISKFSGLIILISLLVMVSFYVYYRYHILSLEVVLTLGLIPLFTIIIAVISYYLAPKISSIVFNKISGMFYDISLKSKGELLGMLEKNRFDIDYLFERFKIQQDDHNIINVSVFLNVYFKTKQKGFFNNNNIENKVASYRIYYGEGNKSLSLSEIKKQISDEDLFRNLIGNIETADSKLYYELELKCFCLTMPDYEIGLILD